MSEPEFTHEDELWTKERVAERSANERQMTQQSDWKERESIVRGVCIDLGISEDAGCDEIAMASAQRRDHIDEVERESSKYKTRAEGLERSHNEDIKTFERIAKSVGMDFCCCSETPELESRVRAELASREQRINELEKLIIDSQKPHGTCYWGLGYGFTSEMKEACTSCEAKRQMKAIAALEAARQSEPES